MFFEPGIHSQHASMKQMGLEMFCILDVMYKKKDWQFVYSCPAWENVDWNDGMPCAHGRFLQLFRFLVVTLSRHRSGSMTS